MDHRFSDSDTAGGQPFRRCFASSLTLLRDKRLRRILELSGHTPRLGWPKAEDAVLIWGNGRTAARGQKIVVRTGASPIYLEDAFLRSIHPGRAGSPPLGLIIDPHGLHFDPAQPSGLERLLTSHPLDETAALDRARACIARLRTGHLSKYNAFDPHAAPPAPGYVLVIDQISGDASVRASGGTKELFDQMLLDAQLENPGQTILIRTHPETAAGLRHGMYGPADTSDRVHLHDDPATSPWHLLEGATAVYTLSSQLGFEAILAGHKPHVYGQPFYAGWGLTQDRNPLPRRARNLTTAQLFLGAMILYPTWYDPYRDCLCEIEQVIDTLEAETRAYREDRAGWVASGMRLWKRGTLARFFGQTRRIRFEDDPEKAGEIARKTGARWMAWAGKTDPDWSVTRIEDGFVRSRGLGAALVPPLSLVADKTGIYYDPTRPSDLEATLNDCARLRPDQIARAEAVIRSLTDQGLSKYNLGGGVPDLPARDPARPRILVPGQVEDDASILRGTRGVATNLALLEKVRRENPEAVILYKPHPDVVAGLRQGAVPNDAARALADVVLGPCDPAAILEHVDAVWTMTSTMGFEALLRGVPVSVLGTPFYAGWGLTRDLAPAPARRHAHLSLAQLVYGVLIRYPRYFDPVTQRPCPIEVALDRLAGSGEIPTGWHLRLLAKLQGRLASHAHLWR